MSQKNQDRRIVLLVALLFLGGGLAAWYGGLFPKPAAHLKQNAIMVIAPYQYQGTWVFDDPSVGLVREPFVAGIPEMMDILVKDVPQAGKGFRLTVSAQEFPTFQKKLTWLRGNKTGNFYKLDEPPIEGWLCPALFKYYDEAPKELFVRADPLTKK